MSLKVLRGNIARQIINTKSCSKFKYRKIRSYQRGLATQTAQVANNKKFLTSPWGEIMQGNETLTEYIFKDLELWPDSPALSCGISGRSYDYGMMRVMIERCASALISAVKLSPGDRLGVILPNIPEFPIITMGAMDAGLVVTFANPLYTAGEVTRQFQDCNVKAIATIEMFMPVAQAVGKNLKDYKGTIFIGGNHDKAQNVFGLQPLMMEDHNTELPKPSCDDVCLIPYSSGTTGLPKGVMLTHRNLVSNLKQTQTPKLMKYDGEKGHGDTALGIPPFFHIYGFNGILNYIMALGYHIISLPRFTPEDYIKTLKEHKPSILFVVPSLITFLATHPAVKKEHLKSVTTIMVGAAQTTDSMFEKFLMKCEKSKADIRLLQGYGMTESSPVTLMTPYNYPHDKIGSVGQLLPSTQAKVISLVDGKMMGPYKSGELLVRGPQIMKGYWNNEQATKETIDDEGWLHTGDVMYYDDSHFFYVVDRTKELIKVKGNQVSPTEIENIIMELPQVAEAAVVGMPDPLAGEVPKAFVVLKANKNIPAKEICDVVAQKLAKYKHLSGGVQFVESIPRNAAGKILRNELKVLVSKH